LQIALAKEKSQPLHSQKSRGEQNKSMSTMRKIVILNVTKRFVCKPKTF